MLQRGHSDFAWFRERAQSLQSDTVSAYTEMASTSAQGRLNPEPSQLQDRADHDLPPKSYADAVNEPPNQNGDTATLVLDKPEEAAPNGPAYPCASMVNGQSNQDRVIYEKHTSHNGETSLASIKPSDDHEESLRHNAKSAPREKKSTRPSKRQNMQLASGRRAGEGWQRSAYGICIFLPAQLLLMANTEFAGLLSVSRCNDGFRLWRFCGTRHRSLSSSPYSSYSAPFPLPGRSSFPTSSIPF